MSALPDATTISHAPYEEDPVETRIAVDTTEAGNAESTTATSTVLELQDLEVHYGPFRAVRDVNLAMRAVESIEAGCAICLFSLIRAAVVTSAGAIAAALRYLLGLDHERMLAVCLALYNTGVTELRVRRVGPETATPALPQPGPQAGIELSLISMNSVAQR